MSVKKVIVIGAGDHAAVMYDLITNSSNYEMYAWVSVREELGKVINGVKVIGTDDDLEEIYSKDIGHAVIGIGSVKNNNLRNVMYDRVRKIGFKMINLIHPSALFTGKAAITEFSGCQILAGTVISSDVELGMNTVLYSGCVIEHNCVIRSNCYLSPGVVLSGNVVVNENCFIGAGTTVIQGVNIGKNCVIGAGSVILKDIPPNSLVYGIPARIIKAL